MLQSHLPHHSSRDSLATRLALALILPPIAFSALATWHAAALSFHPTLGAPMLPRSPWLTVAIALAATVAICWLRMSRPMMVMLTGTVLASGVFSFLPVYAPTAPFSWLFAFRHTPLAQPLAFHIAVISSILVVVAVALVHRSRWNDRIHGSSRFASTREMQRAGLFAKQGIALGRHGHRPVRHAGDEHVLAIMPTGAGKTTSYLIPSILSMTEDSIVVADIKGAEIFTATAGARRLTHRVIRFEPAARPSRQPDAPAPTACWNPLDEVPRDHGDVAALQRQAAHLIVPGRFGRETHWHRAARELYVLLALHVMHCPEHTSSLGGMRRLLLSSATSGTAGGVRDVEEASSSALFTRILGESHKRIAKVSWRDPLNGIRAFKHPEVTQLARRFQATEHRELSSIISTLATFLEPWADARIDHATSRSDFSLRDVAPGTVGPPVALYIVIPRHDLARLAPLLRLFYGSFASLVCQATRFRDWKTRPKARRRRTYVFLDEFPMLGYMPVFGDMLATLRGYGATLFIVAQDLAQLRNIYGPHEPITGGCPLFLASGSQRPETLRHISALAGDTTVLWDRSGQSTSGGGLFGKRSRSKSKAEARRPLLTPGEVRTLGDREALLFAPGLHPIALTKAPYFRDRALRKLAALPPPTLPIVNEIEEDPS